LPTGENIRPAGDILPDRRTQGISIALNRVVTVQAALRIGGNGWKRDGRPAIGDSGGKGKAARGAPGIGALDIFLPGGHAISVLITERGRIKVGRPIGVHLVEPPLGSVLRGKVGSVCGDDGVVGLHIVESEADGSAYVDAVHCN